jgi:DNA-binding CsgD family transcriptional regulator
MSDVTPSQPIGRDGELRQIDRFLASAAREPTGLVVEGPAGIGKSTLAEAAMTEARRRGFEVLAARPTGAEASWAYQSLADLLAGADDALAALPALQRRALEVALLRAAAPRSDESAAPAQLVSAGTVSALVTLARRHPVLLAIDDAPWLDPATTAVLGSTVRRLGRHPIGVVVTQRVDDPGPAPLELDRAIPTERAWLTPLSLGALHLLLTERLDLTLPRPTLVRLHEMAGGNPFHALEIGRALQRLPNLPRPGEPLPVPRSVRELVRSHLATVRGGTRETLLVAAAAGSPSLDELRAAAGPGADASLEEAADVGLLGIDGGIVRFSHPTIASAVYEEAAPAERRHAHAVLAAAAPEPEARGRHMALATILPDADVAAALELAAVDAKRRGAAETAADLARLALDRTPPDDLESRGRRGVRLASILLDLADLPAAQTLVRSLIEELPPGRDRAEARMIAGTIAWYIDEEAAHAASRHLVAALPEAVDDRELLGRIHYRLSIFYDFDAREALRHARLAVEILRGLDAPVTLAAAMFAAFSIEVGIGEPPNLRLLDDGLAIEADGTGIDKSTLPGIWWVATGQLDRARERFEAMLEGARNAGDASGTADLLTRLAETALWADRWHEALALADEARIAAQQEGQSIADPARRIRALIDAHQGRLDDARAVATLGADRAAQAGDMVVSAAYVLVLAFVAASEGQWAEVEAQSARSAAVFENVGTMQPLRLDTTPERIEALVALGRLDEAEAMLGRYVTRSAALGLPWADAAIARSSARLLAARGRHDEGVAATAPALDERSASWSRFDRARVLLARGELLRHARSRRDAGEAIDTAIAIFDELGAPIWAERARAESARLGRSRSAGDELTPTERRVAELAASGLRNRDVAEELGISDKTVEAHLAHVYQKLGIRSRAELGRAFPDASG